MMMRQTKGPSLALVLLTCAACGPMSEQIRVPAAGLNGGFEHFQKGLPANWLVYSPATVPDGRFEVGADEADRKEGRRSLRFKVDKCSADGGWLSPGIAQEVPAEPGDYVVRLWVKTEGSRWRASIGGVTAKTGDRARFDSSAVKGGGWQRVERPYTLRPEFDRLRFEFNVLSPGTVWIDGLEIVPAAGAAKKAQ